MMDGMQHGMTKASASNSSSVFGILYAEDFDNPADNQQDSRHSMPEPSVPIITQGDVDAACAAAVQAARAEWQNADEQKRLTAIAALGPVLAGIRDVTEQAALLTAEATVTTILSIVTGLLPHFSQEHGAEEVRALLGRLLPTIRSQTRIHVRVHPDLVATMQGDVAELEPDLAALIDITAAPLERGDVKVTWENGSMVRDTRKIMQAIQDALGQLGLQQPVEATSKKRMAYAE